MPQTAAQRARTSALLRLKEKHKADFDAFYDEEREKLGLRPVAELYGDPDVTIEALRARIERLQRRKEAAG